MRRKLLAFAASLCCLMFLAGTSMAADIPDPILKKLVEKGVLTKEEAISVLKEMDKESAKQEQKIEEKIEKKVSAAPAAENKDIGKVVKALKGFKFGLLWYLSYQNGTTGNMDGGAGYSKFDVKRGYFTVEKEFMPWFSARTTLDVTTVKDSTSNLDGSLSVRLKYMYGKFNIPDFAFFTKPNVEIGLVHMPWLDFEEHLNYYRLQDTMFIERNGIFNSADVGLTFTSLLGGTVDETYQKEVNNAYPGRYGSVQFGIYNGGGYHASEKNQGKPFEARLTLRPLPDFIPGLQVSYFGLWGKGNTSDNPDWQVNNGMLSFEHKDVVLTGQYYWGKGQQNGSNEDKKKGYSFFTELKLYNMIKDSFNKFSIIGRFDHFDPNTELSDDDNNRYIAGLAYYLDKPHQNMLLLDYDTVDYKQKGKSDDKRIQLTLQVAL
jgi:polyhydroxyalkanoate synthesis regulator phasin